MIPNLPLAVYIESEAGLEQVAQTLAQEPLLAVDTESNSLYAYQSQVCLIQLSTRTTDYIIDPLAMSDMQPLGDLLADKRIEKIFHAAEYDLLCLKRDFDFDVQNLFDTMYAARLCHIESFGLADLLAEFLQVEVDKSHQLDNWGERPLQKESLIYAQMDTHYLPMLRDILMKRLLELQRLEEAREVFADVLRIEVKSNGFDPDGYWKLGKPHGLTRRQMAVLRELYLLRDEMAREEDMPHFKVITNNVLVEMAQQQPRSYTQLFDIPGLSPRYVRTWGDELLSALDQGRSSRLPRRPKMERPTPRVIERYTALHAWRKELAEKRGLDASLVLSKQTLWDLANHPPQDKAALSAMEGFGAWRLRTYGDDLLKVLKTLH